MLNLKDFSGIYLYQARVDFRKAINGLSEIVESEMKLSIFERNLFLFINRNRSRIKILYWDKTGFALWMKRLEKDKFSWPKGNTNQTFKMSEEDLRLLLRGYDIWKIKSHRELKYTCIG